MLKTKCILLPASLEDGWRMSVMSRHTLSDGVTADARINAATLDAHWPELGPAPRLIGAYLRGTLGWDAFTARFAAQLATETAQRKLQALARMALATDVTLLCVEHETECGEDGALRCHRRLVALATVQIEPRLVIDIR